jgi:serine/threonine-protein kinase
MESVRYAQAALAARPTSYLAHCKLAACLALATRFEDGLKEARIAYQLAPTIAINQLTLGQILTFLHRPDEGLPLMIRACEIEPNHPDWYTVLGIAYAEQNRHEDALPVFRRAISIDPKRWVAHQRLRESLQKLGRWEESRLAWRQLLDADPPDQEAWDGYAELTLYLGDEDEYRRVRTELLKRFGEVTDPRVAERTGRACLLLPLSDDELRQSTRLIDRALASQREKPDWLLPYFRFAKALAEYRGARLENALTLLDAATLNTLGPAPGLLLAMVQHRLGHSDTARDNFRTAVASYGWDAKSATNREAWMYHLLRSEAGTVLASRTRE